MVSFTFGLPGRILAGLLGVAMVSGLGSLGAFAQQDPVDEVVQRGQHADVPKAEMQDVVTRSEAAGLSRSETAGLLRPAVALAEKGSPPGPVLMAALEGLTKEVPLSRLRSSLSATQTRVEESRAFVTRALGPTNRSTPKAARDQLILNIDWARRQGIPEETIGRVWNALEERLGPTEANTKSLAAAFRVLPDLPGTESEPVAAGRLLGEALRAGYTPADLQQLAEKMRETGARHQPGRVRMAQATRAVARGGSPAAVQLPILGAHTFGGPPAAAALGWKGTPPVVGPPDRGGRPPNETPPPGNQG